MVKFTVKALGNGEINLPQYNQDLKDKAFWIWYNNGKLPATKLLLKLQETEKIVPPRTTLYAWMSDWKEHADELDQQIKDEFSADVVQTKVEMLRRHASVGKELQSIGIEWLRENLDSLTAAAVTRLIKDGYEMERSSVGVPEALEKMLAVSDDDLKKQIEAALTGDDLDLFDAD